MKEAWVLRLKDEVKFEGVQGDYFLCNEEYSDSLLTNDLQQAIVYYDKEKTIEEMKAHEAYMKERYGENAICNFGYTNMMKNLEFVEVEIEEV